MCFSRKAIENRQHINMNPRMDKSSTIELTSSSMKPCIKPWWLKFSIDYTLLNYCNFSAIIDFVFEKSAFYFWIYTSGISSISTGNCSRIEDGGCFGRYIGRECSWTVVFRGDISNYSRELAGLNACKRSTNWNFILLK